MAQTSLRPWPLRLLPPSLMKSLGLPNRCSAHHHLLPQGFCCYCDHWMPSAFHHLNLLQLYEVSTMMGSILQTRKLNLREVDSLTQSHTAHKQRSQGLSSATWNLTPLTFLLAGCSSFSSLNLGSIVSFSRKPSLTTLPILSLCPA